MRLQLAVPFVLLVACAHRGVPPSPPPPPPSLDAVVGEATRTFYEGHPCRATTDGLHAYDTQLPDFAPAVLQARVARGDALLAELGQVDPARLSLDGQVDRAALEGLMRDERLELADIRQWQHNPMRYIEQAGDCIDALMKRTFAPGPDRVRAAVARLQQVPRLLAQGKANVTDAPREFVDLAIRETDGSEGFFAAQVPQWAHGAAPGDLALLAALDAASAQAAQAVRAYSAWLHHELAPRAHGSFALGPELFRKKLLYAEGIDLSLDALRAKGEAQLARDHEDFVATARLIDPRKSPLEVMQQVAEDHPSAQELLPTARRTLEETRAFVVAHALVTIPSKEMPIVAETPPYLRSGTFASMDSPGPYEAKAREAFYYVTPVDPSWTPQHKLEHLEGFNRPEFAVITIHEAFPGHYLQALYAPGYPTPVRRLVQSNSNVEGWAHYAEQMMVEQGFGNGDPRVRLTQLEEALLRDCRYLNGIRLHTQGGTVAEGTKLFVDRCFQFPANAFEEARRGTYDPTYLYYTYGKLEIQALARDYLAQKHGTLKQFHDAFVATGPLPIPLVRRLLLP